MARIAGSNVSRTISPTETFLSGKSISPWYITGLCEGDGTFTYNRNGPRNIALVFALKLSGADGTVLNGIREFFGCGRIYRYPSTQKPATVFRITRINDLLTKVVPHFDKYPLRGRKSRSYLLWREAVALKKDRYRVDQDRLERITHYLSKLQTNRRSSGETG